MCTPRSYSQDKFVSAFSDAAAFYDAQKICTPRHSHSHDKFTFRDTAKNSAFSDAAAFSDAQKTCVPQH